MATQKPLKCELNGKLFADCNSVGRKKSPTLLTVQLFLLCLLLRACDAVLGVTLNLSDISLRLPLDEMMGASSLLLNRDLCRSEFVPCGLCQVW